MVQFIDAHRDAYGVESICTVVPIAPSTYFWHKARHADPTRRSARVQRDDGWRREIQRVWDDNQQVYGPRKVWRQLRRDGHRVARCTVGRLMRAMGLRGAARGRAWVTTTQADGGADRPVDLSGDAVMPGQGRLVERPYTPEERAAMGHGLPVLGETTFDIYLNARAF